MSFGQDRESEQTERLELSPEFYQVVLAAVYHGDGLWGDATFDLTLRDFPDGVGYAVVAGVDDAIDRLLRLRVHPADLDWLRRHPEFSAVSAAFYEGLARFRFSGEVWAMPEGSIVFPGEPILRITAPIIQATLVETLLMRETGFSISIATRASRLADAAGGRDVVDFSARRHPDNTAARRAARAAYVGGVAATSNLEAAQRDGIPSFGTMSQTLLAVYGNEARAYEAFRVHFPSLGNLTLPDDDPREGVKQFLPFKDSLRAVRIQHHDLVRAAELVREGLDAHGFEAVEILGSGGLDETQLQKIAAAGAPVDRFAIGAALADGVPGLAAAVSYRLAEMVRGRAPEPINGVGSALYPGRKQVIRQRDRDILCLETEASLYSGLDGAPMLRPVVINGARVTARCPLEEARERRARGVAALDDTHRDPVAGRPRVPVISDALAALALQD